MIKKHWNILAVAMFAIGCILLYPSVSVFIFRNYEVPGMQLTHEGLTLYGWFIADTGNRLIGVFLLLGLLGSGFMKASWWFANMAFHKEN